MCLAIPGKIVKVYPRYAWVEYPHVCNQAMISNESVGTQNWVMVQMGIIVKILTKTEAQTVQDAWQSFNPK